jgi:hypothetical protein
MRRKGVWRRCAEPPGQDPSPLLSHHCDLFEDTREELADRDTEDRLVGKRGPESRLTDVALVARDLGSALATQQKCHLALGEARSFPKHPKIVVKSFDHEAVSRCELCYYQRIELRLDDPLLSRKAKEFAAKAISSQSAPK